MQNNMGNWIKTKNRLPEDDRTVIATNDNGLVRMANYDHDTHAWKTGHRILNEKIIAWQYVPDTPSALWENDMPESEHRVNVQHTVRGKKTIVDEEAICKYEDITGETFTDETAELMLCRGLMTDKNLELTNDMMSNIINREIYLDIYAPNIYIPVFDNSRLLTINRQLAMYFTMSHSLSTSMLENYLKMSVPEEDENKVQFMSNEELNKLIKEFIIQELKERLEVREILRNGDVILPL